MLNKFLLKASAFIVLIVMLASCGGSHNTKGNNEQNQQQSQGSNQSQNTWLNGCKGDKKVAMTNLPMKIEDVSTIIPLGLVAGAHVTPIDHLYFYPKDMQNRDAAPVYAMADGMIVDISKREVNVDSGEQRPPEYRVVIQHSCQVVSYFDLLTSLDKNIEEEYKKNPHSIRIPVKAGEEIGRVGAQSLDTSIYNFGMVLKGFITPELYKGEFWKVHTDDFFSYFSKDNQSVMASKNPRKVEPLSGRIDYDQKGKLIGNWFQEGSKGYSDPSQSVSKDGKTGYWTTHLAFFYNNIDPSIVMASFGNFGDGTPQNFAVKLPATDPADVSVQSGVVKYELVQSPQIPDNGSTMTPVGNQVLGTVLVQVLDGEKLKMEVFPGKTGSEVSGFTSNAKMYFR